MTLTWNLDQSLIVTFYLAKTENKTQKSLTQAYTIALSKGTIFAKKCWHQQN